MDEMAWDSREIGRARMRLLTWQKRRDALGVANETTDVAAGRTRDRGTKERKNPGIGRKLLGSEGKKEAGATWDPSCGYCAAKTIPGHRI